MRAYVALAALAVVAVMPAADAAPAKKKKPAPPACNLVKDPAGDVSNKVQGVDAFPADDGLDILGSDVATDGKRITAVVRLAADPGTATLYAKRYIVQMNVAGLKHPLLLAVAISPSGTVYSLGYYGPSRTTGSDGFNYPGDAIGAINEKTLTVSAALADVAAMPELGAIKPGAKISAITVTANRRVPSLTQVTGQLFVADDAIGKTPYLAGARSCIKQFTG